MHATHPEPPDSHSWLSCGMRAPCNWLASLCSFRCRSSYILILYYMLQGSRDWLSGSPMLQLRRGCSMHILNLGILQTLVADAIIYLCENEIYGAPATDLDQCLKHAFKAFKGWCSTNRVGCSQRLFTSRSLHVAEYPFINAKAHNCRILIGWLAEPRSKWEIYIIPGLAPQGPTDP